MNFEEYVFEKLRMIYDNTYRRNNIKKWHTLILFNRIMTSLLSKINTLNQENVETTHVYLLEEMRKIDFDYLKKLCENEKINCVIHFSNFDAVCHYSYNVPNILNNNERKLVLK